MSENLCDNNFYRCVQCNFNVHLPCVPIPSSIKHRYHRHPMTYMDSFREDDSGEYYCDVCENERNPMDPVYCCEKCTYIAHIGCGLNEDKISPEKDVSSSVPQSIYSNTLLLKEMEHSEVIDGIHTPQQLLNRFIIHRHPMRFYEVIEKLKKNQYCQACRMVISGPCYVCETCPFEELEYYLHEKCATLPYEIPHPFHSSHPLSLYTSCVRYIVCAECRDVCFGFFYSCNKCDFKLDVKCATLTAHKIGVSERKWMEKLAELHHLTHQHKLVLGNCIDPTKKIECRVCGVPIFGLAYVCSNRNCFYEAHKSCLELPQKIRVPFHLEHMFKFSKPKGSYECYACRPLYINSPRCGYSCEQCDLKLHPTCANSIRRPLKCESHPHNLYYFGTNFQLLFETHRQPPFCSVCGKHCGGAFYRCLECAINFHLDCVPIPRVVHYKRHVHHLIMKDSFQEDDSGEFDCYICEEERYPNDHVYCCEDCKDLFAAHIECVLAKVEDYTAVLMHSQ